MSTSSSHYERLKIAERATAQDIHAAWRAALDRQQRVAGESPIAQAVALADIQTAYEVLSDPRRRAEYDCRLASRRGGARGAVRLDPGAECANDAHAAGALRSRLAAFTRQQAHRLRSWGETWMGLRAARRLLPPLPAGGWAAGLAMAALLGGWWAGASSGGVGDSAAQRRSAMAMQRPAAAAPLPPAAAEADIEAHAQWVAVAARRAPHPLDGEPLRLRR
jgi:hypothetical protein